MFISRFGEEGGKIAGLPALPIEFGKDRRRPGLVRQPPRIGEAGFAQKGVIAARGAAE